MEDVIVYILTGIIAAQGIALVIRDQFHAKERKDLLNRIMAKDTIEYRALEIASQPQSRKTSNGILRGQNEELKAYMKE